MVPLVQCPPARRVTRQRLSYVMQVETLDYQSALRAVTAYPGERIAMWAYGFTIAALSLTMVAAPVHYHCEAFSARDLIGVLGYLFSWICAGLGATFGGIAIGISRGKRGLWPSSLSVLILVCSVTFVNVLPGYGLGNIH